MEKFLNELNEFLNSDLLFGQFCEENNLDKVEFDLFLRENGYLNKTRRTGVMINSYHNACLEYKDSLVSHGVIAKKYNLSGQSLKKDLIELELYDPSKDRARIKAYNETIFDVVDTEEKAYWLGFIYADGYIYSAPSRKTEGRIDYNFELCTAEKDKEHLEKFAKFIKYEKPLKVTKADKNGHMRCRICLSSKHLWNTLNNYGCTPNKSLTLQFPEESIFKDKSLIIHFIRGYFDGDGCISYANAIHTEPCVNVLGSEQFLTKLLSYFPENYHNLQLHRNHGFEETRFFGLSAKKALAFLLILYNNSTIYLQRKYDRFIYFCRLYKKLYNVKEGNIGEGCDANTEITEETKESSES